MGCPSTNLLILGLTGVTHLFCVKIPCMYQLLKNEGWVSITPLNELVMVEL